MGRKKLRPTGILSVRLPKSALDELDSQVTREGTTRTKYLKKVLKKMRWR